MSRSGDGREMCNHLIMEWIFGIHKTLQFKTNFEILIATIIFGNFDTLSSTQDVNNTFQKKLHGKLTAQS